MAFAALQNGTIIAGYRIDGTLGEGGMGTVYRATQLSLDRVVAFKVVAASLSDDVSFRDRFRREGQLQAALDHPHIVPVYEAGEADSLLFLAMRLIEGTTLKQLITSGQLGDRRSMRLLTQMGDALDAAHAKGLVHRDVKPQNILVGAGDHAYLTDFGLTKGRGGTVMTQAGHFVGTIDYIAPEQARGELATPSSDVYSLTCVLCECLTGQPPFVRATEERTLFAHLTDPPPKLSALRGDLPPAIDEVVARGMAKDPAERPASARDLMVEARRALGALPAQSATDEAEAGQTRLAAAPQAGATRIATAADVAGRAPGAAALPAPGAAPATAPAATAPADTAPGAAATMPAGAAAARPHAGFWVVAALVVIVAAVVGAIVGGGSGGTTSAPYSNSASAGVIELSFPTGWERGASAPAIPGLTLADPIALVPTTPGSSSALVAGTTTATGPTLLPAALTAQVPGGLPAAKPVRLGDVDALSYAGLSARGGPSSLVLYAVPTTAGVVTIACTGPPAAATTTTCQRIAATLHVMGATAYPLGPDAAYAATLTHTFTTLSSARASGEAALAAAKTPGAQSAAAAKLSSAYAAAAASLAGLRLSPAVARINAQLSAALSSLSRDYARVSHAAARSDQTGYRLASAAIARDGAQLTSTLSGLRSAGY
jgi:serine/threonine-protein kinase